MSALGLLRWLSWFEGASLLALSLVAMPLKHVWGLPEAVRVVGSVHGLLFVMFGVTLARVSLERAWSWRRALLTLLLAAVPGGAFAIERALRREAA